MADQQTDQPAVPAPPTPVELSNDFGDYSNGELEDLEDASGKLLGELDGKPLSRRTVNALLWITQRRSNPDLTLAEVRAMRRTVWVWQPVDPPVAPVSPSGREQPPPSAPSTA
ncbi:MAG: hypothetical protein L0Y54_21015 [Sporichthyaceae bacterium]|nr:hypothetical protein [Sporichthyaceae bacterium]